MEREMIRQMELSEEFRKSLNLFLLNRIRKSRLILYAVRQNYISLIKSFKKFHINKSPAQLWSNDTPHWRWNIQKRLTTDLLNYLSSVVTVIDISRDFARRELSEYEYSDYQRLIKLKFNGDIEFRIIRKLRNYASHYALLDIHLIYSYNIKKGKKKFTALSPEILLRWNGWDKQERDYLEAQKKHFNIEPIISRYHSVFLEVQDQLLLKVLKKYKNQIESLIKEMELLKQQWSGFKNNIPLPYRTSTLRYLKWINSKI